MKLAIAQYIKSEKLNYEERKYYEELLDQPADACSAIQNGRLIKFELTDVEYKNKKYPDSFFIPSLEIRKSVQLGMAVKVIADWMDYESNDERFWVKLTEEFINENGLRTFFGECRNNTQVLNWGTKFGPIHLHHICDIDFEEFNSQKNKEKIYG